MLIVHFVLRILYRSVAVTGLFSTRTGLRIYQILYDIFKIFTEDKAMRKMADHVKLDSLVIDVGANVGFCTRYFLKKIGTNGKVAAVEPESLNIGIMRQRFSKMIKSGHLVLFDCIATNNPGNYYHLHIDRYNPGGHVVGPDGIPVKGVTVDHIVSEIGMIPSLIKIDVEGYEEFVIEGAKNTIERHHPILFMEFHPGLLSDYGTDYTQLLGDIAKKGYKFFLFNKKDDQFDQFSIEKIIEKSLKRGWSDVLLIPVSNC